MVTIDKIFHASVVLKNIIRPTPLTKTAGIAPNCDLYLNIILCGTESDSYFSIWIRFRGN